MTCCTMQGWRKLPAAREHTVLLQVKKDKELLSSVDKRQSLRKQLLGATEEL